MEKNLWKKSYGGQLPIHCTIRAYLINGNVCDLFPPECFTIDICPLCTPGALVVDDHSTRISSSSRLHDTSSLGLQCLFGISVDESIKERDEGVERDVGRAGEWL